MNYEIFERRFRLAGPERRWWLWWVVREEAHYEDVASCTSPEAAEAARRLLSGECAQGLAEAQIDRMVAAKTGAGKPMRGCNHPEFYANGLADGAAQERARIVAFAKTYVKSPIRADVLAEMIERGEAGE